MLALHAPRWAENSVEGMERDRSHARGIEKSQDCARIKAERKIKPPEQCAYETKIDDTQDRHRDGHYRFHSLAPNSDLLHIFRRRDVRCRRMRGMGAE